MVAQISRPALTVTFTKGESSTAAEKVQARVAQWTNEVAATRILPLEEGGEMLIV